MTVASHREPGVAERDALVILSLKDRVAEIHISNGPLNLITRALLQKLNEALSRVESLPDLRCVILHAGDARVFSAGSDIKEFAHLRSNASEEKILFEDMVLRRLANLRIPTIAAVGGPALGGGLELALACDLRVSQQDTRFGLTESRLGGLAGNGSLRLARLIGPARAKQMLFTGETVTGEQALEWGLVNSLATNASALEGAREVAGIIASRGPLSNRLAKRLVDAAMDLPLGAGLTLSTEAQQDIFNSADLHEGVKAFFDKRDPEFKNQ